MGYGAGRSRLYAAYGKEEAKERKQYEKQLARHESAVEKESKESGLFSTIGSTLGAAVGFYYGGFGGAAKGWTLGGEAGKWGQNILFSDYDPEDYALNIPVGKFDVSKKYEYADINRQFEEAWEAQKLKDITGTGTSIATMAMFGGDGGTEEGTKSFWDMTGQEMLASWKT